MVKNEKKEPIEDRLKRETGFPQCRVEDIKILNNVKVVNAVCETESGTKKDYTFLLDDDNIYFGQRIIEKK